MIAENESQNNVLKPFELSKEQKEELKEAFEVFDADGNGSINAEELQIVLEAVGRKMTEDEVADAITKVDEGGNGEIEFDEFLQLMTAEMSNTHNDEELIEAFKFYGPKSDKDGITRDMLGETLKNDSEINLPDEDLDMLFNETAIENGKKITFSDFMLMMMPK